MGGKKSYELGVGIHSLTKEQRQEIGKKGSNKTKELGVGLYGLSKEQRSAAGRNGANIQKELKLGIHGRTKEKMSEHGKKAGKIGGKISSSQKWKCTVTGHITNAGALTKYQKARGIDRSMRIRLE